MPKKLSAILLGVLSALSLATPVWANHIPAPAGYVNDFAGVLTADQKGVLEAKLRNYQARSTNEIAVAFVKNLRGGDINDFTVRAFEEWKIGKKGQDNGVLFLAAIEDRKMRIEVGYGLEPKLTDGTAGQIIRSVITPKFKQGEYYGGINDGTDAIIASLEGSYNPASNPVSNFAEGVVGFLVALFGELGFYAGLLVSIMLITYLASFLARSESIWLGGVIGSGVGLMIGLAIGVLLWILVLAGVLGGLGLLLDWLLSRNYQKLKASGKKTDWWTTGGGFWLGGAGGGGGFGGFGGGGSGGGGSSGGW